jgi:hypothetical protein
MNRPLKSFLCVRRQMSARIPLRALLIPAALLATLACGGLSAVLSPTPEPSPTSPPTNTPLRTVTPRPTATPRPRATFTPQPPPCLDPSQVSLEDVGKTVVVCGLVVEEGELPCPSCAYGAYSYMVLKGGFNIISYHWNFVSYDNICLMASDKVEQLGTKPIFVYGASEGYAGSECTRESDGSLTCAQGAYFLAYDGC